MKLGKAKFIVLDLESATPDRIIEVMFNPNSFSLKDHANWLPEKETHAYQFIGSTQGDLVLNLVFDTYESGMDVRLYVKRLSLLTLPVFSLAKNKKPPLCLFVYGTFFYQGIVTEVDNEYTMFSSLGIPIRAKCKVTMRHVPLPHEVILYRGLEACRKVFLVKYGDRLDRIAAQELKDAKAWPKIARANKISDPINFPQEKDIGRWLIIPD